MLLYIAITIAALGAAYMIQCTQKAACLDGTSVPVRGTRGYAVYRASFWLLFLILVIPAILRQACGNDYMRYVEFFHLASVGAYVPTEPGFNAFVRLIYGLCGYENYILVFALFSIMTIALFLLAIREQAQNFAMSFFLFLMCGYYFQTYNTIRYYFALALALFALRFFLERQYLPFVLCILFAATFHKSVLCVLVLYPLCAWHWRKWQAALLALLGGLLNVFHSQVMALIVQLYPSYEDTDILAAGGHLSPANIARCAAVLLLCLACWHWRGKDQKMQHEKPLDISRAGADRQNRERFYINAAGLSLFIYVFCWFVPEVSRIAYYLVITQIFLVPEEILSLPGEGRQNSRRRKLLLLLVGAIAIVMFAAFLHRAYASTIRILPYKTFLFSDLPATPSRSIE